VTRNKRVEADEIVDVAGLPVTTPERTALDLARHLPRDPAVRNLDALARATGVKALDALVLADRYPRARGLRRAETALSLMDGGAQSPKETWLPLLLIDDGLPTPRRQIRVSDGVNEAFIDMGYDEPMVGLDYDGEHHSSSRGQYVYDIGRAEFVDSQGWIDIHVVAEHSSRFVLHRVREAFRRRAWDPPPAPISTPRL
jgi:very-short-patch-repair endonuclease